MQRKLKTLTVTIAVSAATLFSNQVYAGNCIQPPCPPCTCGESDSGSSGNSSDNNNDNCEESSGGQTSGSTSSVDLSRGGLYYSDTNLKVESHIPIKAKLVYNSALIGMNGAVLPLSSSFSPGWNWEYDAAFITVVSVNGIPFGELLGYRALGDSLIDGYNSADGINYIPHSGVYDFAKRTASGGIEYTTKFGRRLIFNDSFPKSYIITTPEGVANVSVMIYTLTGMEDRNGNTLTINRGASHEVTSVVSSDGASITVASEPHPLFSGFKRITAITADDGRTVTYSYDSDNKLQAFTDPEGGEKTFTYTPNYLMLSCRHSADNSGWDVEYDAEERANKKTLTDGTEWNIVYNYTASFDPATLRLQYSDGHTDYTTPDGHTVTRYYNSSGNFTKEVDGSLITEKEWSGDSALRVKTKRNPDGTTLNFEYNAQGDKTRSVDQAGQQVLRTFDPIYHRMTSKTDQNGQTSTFAYDPKGNLTSKTDANGHAWVYEYSSKGDKTKETCPLGNSTFFEYNTLGQIIKRTDALGNITTYEYDSCGFLSKVTDPENKFVRFENDILGRKIFEWDKNGNILASSHDSYGNLVAHVGPLGDYNEDGVTDKNDITSAINDNFCHTFTYNWKKEQTSYTDETGRLTQYIRDAASNLLKTIYPDNTFSEFTYDSRGNRTSSKDPAENITVFEFDSMNRMTKITDAFGRETVLAYNDLGQLVSKTLPGNRIWQYTYTPTGKPATRTDPEGAGTSSSYDPVGNLLVKTSPDGATETFTYNSVNFPVTITDSLGGTVKFFYNQIGKRIKTEDKNGNETLFRYNKRSEIIEQENALGAITAMEYDSNGNLVKITDAAGSKTYNFYDFRNRIIKTKNPLRQNSRWKYDNAGNMVEFKDPKGRKTYYLYDIMNRRIKRTNPAGGTVEFEYNANGNMLKRTPNDGVVTTFAYDELNRNISVTDNVDKTSHTIFNEAGFVSSKIDRNGIPTAFEYDKLGRVIEQKDALNNTMTFAFYADGMLHTLTDANGEITEFFYDDLNRLIRKKFADNGELQYSYDANGNLISKVDQKGNVTTFTFSALNQLTKKETVCAPGVGGSTLQEFSYDVLGRVVATSDNNNPATPDDDAVIARTYDRLSNLKSETLNGGTISYRYDRNSNIRKMTYPSGKRVYRSFNRLNQIRRIRTFGHSRMRVSFKYDNLGKLLRKTYANRAKTEYSYDSLNRIESVKTSGKRRRRHRPLLDGFEYTFGNEGHKLSAANLADPDSTQIYDYDATYQIAAFDGGDNTASWDYDPMGNWNSITANGTLENRTHNEVNELTARDAVPMSYDENGNVTQCSLSVPLENLPPENWFCSWNADNRMIVATSADTKLEFAYDTFGRRILKKVYSGAPGNWNLDKHGRFFYDGFLQIEERDALNGNSLEKQYVWANNQPVSMTNANRQTFYYLHDTNKNVTALMDKRARVVARYVYSPFGRMLKKSGSQADENPFRFSSEFHDQETGLVYYNYRYYSPELGRWLSRDPIGEIGSLNLYSMVRNNAVSLWDSLGLKCEDELDVFTNAVSACNLAGTTMTSRTNDLQQTYKDSNAKEAIFNKTLPTLKQWAQQVAREQKAGELTTATWNNYTDAEQAAAYAKDDYQSALGMVTSAAEMLKAALGRYETAVKTKDQAKMAYLQCMLKDLQAVAEADAKNDCMYCIATCAVAGIAGLGQDNYSTPAAEKLALKIATSTAAKGIIKRCMPYVGAVTAVIEGGMTVNCVLNCTKN